MGLLPAHRGIAVHRGVGDGSVTRRTLCFSTNISRSDREAPCSVFAKFGKHVRGCPRDFACNDMMVNAPRLSAECSWAPALRLCVCVSGILSGLWSRLCFRRSPGISGSPLSARSRRWRNERESAVRRKRKSCMYSPSVYLCMRLGAVYRRRMGAGRAQVCVSVSNISRERGASCRVGASRVRVSFF